MHMINNKNLNYLRKSLFYFGTVGSLMCLFIAAFWWDNQKNTNKPHVKFSNTRVLNIDSYKSLIHKIIDNDIDKINLDQLVDTLEAHPYTKVVRVSRHYPNQIIIEIMEREPIAIVNKNPLVLLDDHGIVLPNEPSLKSFNLPFMTNFNKDSLLYPPGKKTLSLKLKECISLISEIKNKYNDLYNNLSELKITSDNEIELVLYDNSTQIFLGNDFINYRINVLKEFEKELNPKKISDFAYLDMRYDNQVIAKRRRS